LGEKESKNNSLIAYKMQLSSPKPDGRDELENRPNGKVKGEILSNRGFMKRITLQTIFLTIMLSATSWSQEVIIRNFPSGVGGSVKPEIFQPFLAQLKDIADSLHSTPTARAIVIGGADGGRYRDAHDAKNPGLAVGRAQILRNFLIREYKVDSSQLIMQSEESTQIGPDFRFVSIRLLMQPVVKPQIVEVAPPPAPVVVQAPPPAPIINQTIVSGFSGLLVGVGGSSSHYGGMPVAVGAIVWKKQIYIEGIFGHTIWNTTKAYQGVNLDVRNRMAGGAIAYFPVASVPVGLLGGWVRVEEISQTHYSYVRMSEGPLFGIRWMPVDFVSLTGAYNPSKERIAGNMTSSPYDDQFFISATIHTLLGGDR
jgi:hypothetical protein